MLPWEPKSSEHGTQVEALLQIALYKYLEFAKYGYLFRCVYFYRIIPIFTTRSTGWWRIRYSDKENTNFRLQGLATLQAK